MCVCVCACVCVTIYRSRWIFDNLIESSIWYVGSYVVVLPILQVPMCTGSSPVIYSQSRLTMTSTQPAFRRFQFHSACRIRPYDTYVASGRGPAMPYGSLSIFIFHFSATMAVSASAAANDAADDAPNGQGNPATGKNRGGGSINASANLKRQAKEEDVPAASTTSTNDGVHATANKRRAKRRPLHVEAVVLPSSSTSLVTIRSEVQRHVTALGRQHMMYRAGPIDLSGAPGVVQNSCSRVAIVDFDEFEEDTAVPGSSGSGGGSTKAITASNGTIGTWLVSSVRVYAYVLSDEEASAEELDTGNDNDDEDLTACETLPLPHSTLAGLWDSLILPPMTKSNLLQYASSALLFSDKLVSPHIVGWNRVVLLHGPPGTGKTSLCRALAHKLSIRLSDRFVNGGYLLEIHSHSLFSKWFSESGKLVSRLFDRIREMVEDDEDALVCVLVDEVESLAAARSAGTGGAAGEPSDAVRAVNSLLTSIDRLRQYGNVVVMTTSNITGSVDVAFVDRADVKQYIGLPILEARYEILRSCVLELIRVGIVTIESPGAEHDDMELAASDDEAEEEKLAAGKKEKTSAEDMAAEVGNTLLPSHRQIQTASASLSNPASALLKCAELADGMSGRSLRKLPFQSHALYIRSADPVTLDDFLDALRGGIIKEQDSRKTLGAETLSECKCECTCGAKAK